MKGWLQTLGLTALLASHALANDAELVCPLIPSLHSIGKCRGLTLFCRNPTMRTDNDAQGCTVAKLGEEMLTPSFWLNLPSLKLRKVILWLVW